MKKYILLLLCLIALLFSGCGAGGGSAPPGSTITINPSSMTYTVTDGNWWTQYYTITVEDSTGNPINGAKITITYTWATASFSNCVQLYNGSTKVYSPFDAETDEFGVYNLRFDFYGSDTCANKGDIEVRSGDAFVTASFSLN